MPEYLLVQLPNGKEWEMTAHIARQLYDFIEERGEKNENPHEYDYEREWLAKLPDEDQRMVKK